MVMVFSTSSQADMTLQATPPSLFNLETAMEFIDVDELIEVTPSAIRLRKKVLNPSFRPNRLESAA